MPYLYSPFFDEDYFNAAGPAEKHEAALPNLIESVMYTIRDELVEPGFDLSTYYGYRFDHHGHCRTVACIAGHIVNLTEAILTPHLDRCFLPGHGRVRIAPLAAWVWACSYPSADMVLFARGTSCASGDELLRVLGLFPEKESQDDAALFEHRELTLDDVELFLKRASGLYDELGQKRTSPAPFVSLREHALTHDSLWSDQQGEL